MILVVVGPTGVGKTKLSVELAKKYNAIVVNGDSMQVYKGLDIGTAKVTEEEKCGIDHFLFDVVSVEDMYTVFDYQRDLRKVLELYKDRNIVIVGGTGLYIKAGLYNYVFEDDTSYDTYNDISNEELYEKVKEKYPNLDIHVNNRKRLIRALNKKEDYDNKGNELLYDAKFIGIDLDRDVLYDRINRRVDIMVKDGLIEEARKLYDEHIYSKAVMTCIGYKELYMYFDGKISLNEALDLIKKNSRHYAKRQYTWFKNQMDVKWFKLDKCYDETYKEIIAYLEGNK